MNAITMCTVAAAPSCSDAIVDATFGDRILLPTYTSFADVGSAITVWARNN
jgi:hypothetical protein